MSLVNLLDVIGNNLPLLTPIIAYFGLNNKPLALLLALDSLIINPSLKRLVGFFGLQSKRPHCASLDKYSCFGMPSGHTEIHWILLTYVLYQYFYKKNTKVLPILVLVSIMTAIVMWQRLYSGMHTPLQILMGALAGITIALIFIYSTDSASSVV